MNTTEKLQNAYGKLKTLYDNIYKTYEEQREAFKTENEEQVQRKIAERSDLMVQVDHLTEEITQSRNTMGEQFSSTKEIEELRQSIKDILQKTIELDKNLRAEMQFALGENRQKRQELQQGKKVFNAYNKNQAASLFLDKQK